jgi:hypothetical protein
MRESNNTQNIGIAESTMIEGMDVLGKLNIHRIGYGNHKIELKNLTPVLGYDSEHDIFYTGYIYANKRFYHSPFNIFYCQFSQVRFFNNEIKKTERMELELLVLDRNSDKHRLFEVNNTSSGIWDPYSLNTIVNFFNNLVSSGYDITKLPEKINWNLLLKWDFEFKIVIDKMPNKLLKFVLKSFNELIFEKYSCISYPSRPKYDDTTWDEIIISKLPNFPYLIDVIKLIIDAEYNGRVHFINEVNEQLVFLINKSACFGIIKHDERNSVNADTEKNRILDSLKINLLAYIDLNKFIAEYIIYKQK